MDRHSGTVLNKVGETIRMPRNEVNDNPELECQKGFHVADYAFATSYSSNDGHMIMVSVNPEHVVSMPNAYHFTKMRVCEYTILKEVAKEEKGNLYRTSEVDNDEEDDYDNGSRFESDDEYCDECDELIDYCEC